MRTRVTLRDGAVVRNDVVLTKRTASWVVTGYQLVRQSAADRVSPGAW